MNNSIGGYFELDYIKKSHYHSNAFKLNSARYAIEYILKVRKYKTIYIPYYICDSLLQPLNRIDINIKFYKIDNKLMPILDKKISRDEVVLFINYFGLNNDNILEIKKEYNNIIVDNTQAFYMQAHKGIDTIYSPRKFLGVSDGGYLYIETQKHIDLEQDISYKRYEYLLKRIDVGCEAGYSEFIINERELNNQKILRMSNLTDIILSSIDYKYIKRKRENNFKILHNYLKDLNELDISESLTNNGPMVYPFLFKNDDLRQHLIKNKIYVATYWTDVLNRVEKGSFEEYMTKYLLPLPIDHRYSENEMKYILQKIKEVLG